MTTLTTTARCLTCGDTWTGPDADRQAEKHLKTSPCKGTTTSTTPTKE